MLALALLFGPLIGLVVGAVGGGGAILALPVLVYVLGQPAGPASTASLIVVAVAAAVGAGMRVGDRQVCWRIAAGFALPAALGALAGALANGAVSGRVLILVGFRRAVATSLVIIAFTGLAALASHLVTGVAPPVGITAALALATMAGAVAGSAIADRLPQAALGRAFSLLIAALAVFLLADVLALGGPPT